MKNQSGQALVLVLLSLAVVLTLVLFVLSRSVTDVAVSTKQEESVRAFSAAEAGIEQVLVVGSATGSTQIGDASYNANVTSFSEGTKFFNYPILLPSGDSMTVWFMSHDATDGSLVCGTNPCFTSTGTNYMTVCWGKPGTSASASTTPAVEVTTYYESTPGDLTTIKISRGAYDPNVGRRASNSFIATTSSGCQIDGVDYAFSRTMVFSGQGIPVSAYGSAGGLMFARIKMLYNTDTNHPVGIDVNHSGNSNLPSQGQNIDSTGVAGGSNRRLNVFQGWAEIPSIFEYSVYSSTGLTK